MSLCRFRARGGSVRGGRVPQSAVGRDARPRHASPTVIRPPGICSAHTCPARPRRSPRRSGRGCGRSPRRPPPPRRVRTPAACSGPPRCAMRLSECSAARSIDPMSRAASRARNVRTWHTWRPHIAQSPSRQSSWPKHTASPRRCSAPRRSGTVQTASRLRTRPEGRGSWSAAGTRLKGQSDDPRARRRGNGPQSTAPCTPWLPRGRVGIPGPWRGP